MPPTPIRLESNKDVGGLVRGDLIRAKDVVAKRRPGNGNGSSSRIIGPMVKLGDHGNTFLTTSVTEGTYVICEVVPENLSVGSNGDVSQNEGTHSAYRPLSVLREGDWITEEARSLKYLLEAAG
tara:strand:+ start:352 stop:723 length:372 start_codon:yes stop_codon:yes gene_type:complete